MQSSKNYGMNSPEFKSVANTKFKMNDNQNFNLEFINSLQGVIRED